MLRKGHISNHLIRRAFKRSHTITPYRRSSIKMVSIVNSRFHCTRHGSFVGSTCSNCYPPSPSISTAFLRTFPVFASTHGKLILETKEISGGTSGYFSPQWIFKL